MRLSDIKDHALKSMSHYTPSKSNEYYDEDGHCGDGLWNQILSFWNKFSSNKDFEYVVSGKWFSDDLDLSGGRSYLLSDDKLIDMLFDYMINNLNWSRDNYSDILFNSTDLSDEIFDRFDDESMIRDVKLNSVLDKKEVSGANIEPKKVSVNIWESINFDDIAKEHEEMKDVEMIPLFIRYHRDKKIILDKFSTIEYVKESVEDPDFLIYKIKSLGVEIPSGYSTVKPIKKLI